MSAPSFFETHLGTSLEEYAASPRDRASAQVRARIPDLLYFLRSGHAARALPAPRRTAQLAASLEAALTGAGARGLDLQNLRDRIVTDAFMRSEYDRDQNVYLGPLFTRVLTRAVPDVVFQPRSHQEIEVALGWARQYRVGIATRGAGSTAMGGAVPNDGGLLLDMSRFDLVQVDRQDGVAVIGAGARFKTIHAKLAEHGLALFSYPSNLGGTLAGWFSAGGLGLDSFAHGPVESQVRALSMVLPRGEHVRFHDDGRLDVLSPGSRRLSADDAGRWLGQRGYPALRLADLARTEGQLGVILTISVRVRPQSKHIPFYFELETEAQAIEFACKAAKRATERGPAPANLKYLSAAHVAAVRRLRGDATRAARPAVYVDFDDEAAAATFESRLAGERNAAQRDDAEARRWFADRFRPQQTKRLGPGFLAAEILMPADELAGFVARATRLTTRVGVRLETEAYFFGDGRVLALPGYLTRGPRRGFVWELLLAPMLLDLALARHRGMPYVLGRWQSPYFGRAFPRDRRRALRAIKRKADPGRNLNPGIFFAPAFRVPGVNGFFRAGFPPAVRVLRLLYGSPLTSQIFRALVGAAAGHGAPARSWRADAARHTDPDAAKRSDADAAEPPAAERFAPERLARAAKGCVNCGECNSVCPVFDDAGIRLPQMLTHIGERLEQETTIGGTEQLLLDLCMRCGNCQQVCQADIPHLPLYAALEQRSGALDDPRIERHVAILASLRHSERYRSEFLRLRPGGYVQRTPASLPGEVRFVLFRAEGDAGPDATCIHCGACVPVCPTAANQEFQEGADPRRITTDLNRCIGCGTCVEVCPANLENGGRTLRVMEAPSREFLEACAAFESRERGGGR